MLNQDKFKTAEERVKACKEFLLLHKEYDQVPYIDAAFKWLALEAEEEKPEPCPFCHGDCSLGQDNGDHLGNREYWIDCDEQGCYYRSGNAQSASEAIAAHNRVARAVRAAKESDVK